MNLSCSFSDFSPMKLSRPMIFSGVPISMIL